MNHLRRTRHGQAEFEILHARFDGSGRLQSSQLSDEQVVLGAETVPAFFLLHLLAAQFKKLVLLPDVAYAGSADEEADQQGLHRRPKRTTADWFFRFRAMSNFLEHP